MEESVDYNLKLDIIPGLSLPLFGLITQEKKMFFHTPSGVGTMIYIGKTDKAVNTLKI